MNDIENKTKSILTPLIKGEICLIDTDSCHQLAIWIALKVLVAEHNDHNGFPAVAIFDQNIREWFKKNPEVPNGFKIYIFSQQGNFDSMLKFHRHSAGLSTTPLAAMDSGRRNNIQSVTMGIGKLLIQVLATTDAALYGTLEVNGPSPPVRLWPLTGRGILWPTKVILTDDDIVSLTRILETLIASPVVLETSSP